MKLSEYFRYDVKAEQAKDGSRQLFQEESLLFIHIAFYSSISMVTLPESVALTIASE